GQAAGRRPTHAGAIELDLREPEDAEAAAEGAGEHLDALSAALLAHRVVDGRGRLVEQGGAAAALAAAEVVRADVEEEGGGDDLRHLLRRQARTLERVVGAADQVAGVPGRVVDVDRRLLTRPLHLVERGRAAAGLPRRRRRDRQVIRDAAAQREILHLAHGG